MSVQEDDRGIADFALVDFGVMFKFIEMEEADPAGSRHRAGGVPGAQVLQPAVAAYKGWVTLEQLRKDPNILLYFKNILQKPATGLQDCARRACMQAHVT